IRDRNVTGVQTCALPISATSALGTPGHSWQLTSQGISDFAHKGMLRAAEAMSKTAIHLLHNEKDVAKAKQEFATFKADNPYICQIGRASCRERVKITVVA